MRRYFYTFLLLCATCAISHATLPVPLPDLGKDARIRVVGQNLHNYFLNVNNSFSEDKTEGALKTRTSHIVNAFKEADADIFALCEVEACDEVMKHLMEAMNEACGAGTYAYVADSKVNDRSNGITKVGFLYKKATIKPIGTIQANSGTKSGVYFNRMRWITFEEISTGERFVVSMNHFKAKTASDEGSSQRMTNAKGLVGTLSTMTAQDPDVLVLGDLNCTISEEPMQYLVNTGNLEEQLLRYDASAWSYTTTAGNSLIDHAMANAAMAKQVTGAGICHINHGVASIYTYSDHDMVLVGLNPGMKTGFDVITTEPAAKKVLIGGQILILRGEKMYNLRGEIVR